MTLGVVSDVTPVDDARCLSFQELTNGEEMTCGDQDWIGVSSSEFSCSNAQVPPLGERTLYSPGCLPVSSRWL